jgi:hypothetical protein
LDYLNPKANAPETIAGRLRKVFNDEEDNGAVIVVFPPGFLC